MINITAVTVTAIICITMVVCMLVELRTMNSKPERNPERKLQGGDIIICSDLKDAMDCKKKLESKGIIADIYALSEENYRLVITKIEAADEEG